MTISTALVAKARSKVVNALIGIGMGSSFQVKADALREEKCLYCMKIGVVDCSGRLVQNRGGDER